MAFRASFQAYQKGVLLRLLMKKMRKYLLAQKR